MCLKEQVTLAGQQQPARRLNIVETNDAPLQIQEKYELHVWL